MVYKIYCFCKSPPCRARDVVGLGYRRPLRGTRLRLGSGRSASASIGRNCCSTAACSSRLWPSATQRWPAFGVGAGGRGAADGGPRTVQEPDRRRPTLDFIPPVSSGSLSTATPTARSSSTATASPSGAAPDTAGTRAGGIPSARQRAETARYSGCSKKPWRGGFSRRRSGKPATVSSQPQWTASVPMRWRAAVSRLMVPVAAPAARRASWYWRIWYVVSPAARAARPKKAARWAVRPRAVLTDRNCRIW